MELISEDEYKRLRRLDQEAFYAHELQQDVTGELGTAPIPEETHSFDDEYKHS